MKLENQVVSQELSQKMEKLGFKQESLFYWDYRHKEGEKLKYTIIDKKQIENYECAKSAYTVAELWENLPIKIMYNKKVYTLYVDKSPSQNRVRYIKGRLDQLENELEWFVNVNLADALAKMLIYLKENNLI